MKALKLGTIVTDTASGMDGMLLHHVINQGGSAFYNFQPRGLSPETGAPIKSTWLVPDRIKGGIVEDVDFPLEILGTKAADKASGFSGAIVSVTRHISGCFHACLQPYGRLEKTGGMIESEDFDLRRLKGAAIKEMSDSERAADQKKKPSPASYGSFLPKSPKF